MITASATRETGGRYVGGMMTVVRRVNRRGWRGTRERNGQAGQHQCADQPSRFPPPLIPLHTYQSTPPGERES